MKTSLEGLKLGVTYSEPILLVLTFHSDETYHFLEKKGATFQMDDKEFFNKSFYSYEFQRETRRTNIMVLGQPITGKTSIIEFLVNNNRFLLPSWDSSRFSTISTELDDEEIRNVLPTLGVKVKFLDGIVDEKKQHLITLWELGRALSHRPSRIPHNYYQWMHGFIFVCRADNLSSSYALNNWYEIIRNKRKEFPHITLIHMSDQASVPREIPWNLREELRHHVYFTSIKTKEGKSNIILAFRWLLKQVSWNE